MFCYCCSILSICRIQTSTAAYSDALKHKEAPIVENDVILSESEVREREKLSHLVSLPKEVKLKIINYVSGFD